MAIIQAAVADSELAGMRLKIKRLPNIHCSRIQEKRRRLQRDNPATLHRQRLIKSSEPHPRSSITFAGPALDTE
jgi:hypothetical protein